MPAVCVWLSPLREGEFQTYPVGYSEKFAFTWHFHRIPAYVHIDV
jgi:hypothetical protein